MWLSHLFSWAKTNILVVVLLALVFWLGAKQLTANPTIPLNQGFGLSAVSKRVSETAAVSEDMSYSAGTPSVMPVPSTFQPVAPTDQTERLVITETSLSLLVKDVSASITSLRQAAESKGGFLVSSYLNSPEGADTGTITVRVPVDQAEAVRQVWRDQAVRVTSENVTGNDVTDQYVDLEARLDVLNKTKAKFESIFAEARTVDDSLRVQRELVNLQQQIDAVKGQQQYLEKSAQLVRLTANLATDELALPYAPDQAWRPQAIFKQAARSLVVTLRSFGSGLIWLAVFTPLWLPVLLLAWLVSRRRR